MSSRSPSMAKPLAALRRFTRPRPAVERCDLCGLELPPEHDHIVEPASRQIRCACLPCAILFDGEGEQRYRRVPRDVRLLSDFQLDDARWHALAIPIGLAFFFRSTPADGVVCIYPSPAGPTETLVDADDWLDLAMDNPVLGRLRPDTQALLVNRVGPARDHFLVPIDACYQLVGLIRTSWQGFSGGGEVWGQIGRFFDRLRERAGHA